VVEPPPDAPTVYGLARTSSNDLMPLFGSATPVSTFVTTRPT
jgi:hypothetical protein